MLGPNQLPYLVRYFDGIDFAVSRKLLRRAAPSETTLTEEFCSLMDEATQRVEKKVLSFDLDSLNAKLTKTGIVAGVEFRLETLPQARWLEAYVSQADFGLILEFVNTVQPRKNWMAAYLMQAKRLFRDARASAYTVSSTFDSIDRAQEKRIQLLRRVLGHKAVRYCLYCPPTSGYESHDAAVIRTIHAGNLSEQIFDYAVGLALYERIRKRGGIEAGIWISEADGVPKSAADLHGTAFKVAQPLTWFILNHLHPWPDLAAGLIDELSNDAPAFERVRAVATGDVTALRELIAELKDEARKSDLDPESIRVIPASTMTIRVRIGPPDGVPERD